VEAIANFREGAFSDIEKPQTLAPVSPGKSFHDVRGDRIRGSSQLTSQLEALESRKAFDCKVMQLDEEFVRALPRDQRVMSKVRHVLGDVQDACRDTLCLV
jgi:hypothetical protein